MGVIDTPHLERQIMMAVYATFTTANKMDLGKLEQADVMCFDQNWTKDQWEVIIRDSMVRLVYSSFGLVGFWVAKMTEPSNPEALYGIDIIKIGVMPKHRKQGLSRAILRDIRQWLQSDFLDSEGFQVTLLVPDCLVYPKWPSFIGGWLNVTGFKANRENMLVDCPHSLYGINFQHVIRYDFPRLPTVFGL